MRVSLALPLLLLSCATLEASSRSAECRQRYDACVNACPGVGMGAESQSPAARPGDREPQPSTQAWRADRNDSRIIDCVLTCRGRLCD